MSVSSTEGKTFYGIVVGGHGTSSKDTDPYGMGRVKVLCPTLHHIKTSIDDLPWCYMSSDASGTGSYSFNRPPPPGSMVEIYFPGGSKATGQGIIRAVINGAHNISALGAKGSTINPIANGRGENLSKDKKGYIHKARTKTNDKASGPGKIKRGAVEYSDWPTMEMREAFDNSLASKAMIMPLRPVYSIFSASTYEAYSFPAGKDGESVIIRQHMDYLAHYMADPFLQKAIRNFGLSLSQSYDTAPSSKNFAHMGTKTNVIGWRRAAYKKILNEAKDLKTLNDVLHEIMSSKFLKDVSTKCGMKAFGDYMWVYDLTKYSYPLPKPSSGGGLFGGLGGVASLLSNPVGAITNQITNQVTNQINNQINNITNQVTEQINNEVGNITNQVNNVTGQLNSISDQISSVTGTSGISGVTDSINNTVSGITGSITGTATGAINNVTGSITNAATSQLTGLNSLATGQFNNAGNFSNLSASQLNNLGNLASGNLTGITNLANSQLGNLSNLTGSLSTLTSGPLSSLSGVLSGGGLSSLTSGLLSGASPLGLLGGLSFLGPIGMFASLFGSLFGGGPSLEPDFQKALDYNIQDLVNDFCIPLTPISGGGSTPFGSISVTYDAQGEMLSYSEGGVSAMKTKFLDDVSEAAVVAGGGLFEEKYEMMDAILRLPSSVQSTMTESLAAISEMAVHPQFKRFANSEGITR